MINKVNSTNVFFSPKMNAQQNATSPIKNEGNVVQFKGNLTPAAKLASAYQALNGIQVAKSINFGANAEELSAFEESIIGSKEIRIPNLLAIPEEIDIPRKKMPKGTEHLNAAGLNITKNREDGKDVYTISNDKNNIIFVGKVEPGRAELPVLTYKQGKFMPEITVKDPSLDGKSVKMFAGSELIGDGFELKMPGKYEPKPNQGYKEISFTGRTVITTLNKEPRTLNAVDSYMDSGLQKQAIKGDFADVVADNDPTIVIPAGGFGERFFNITREAENKPSGKLPTDDRYRIIGTTLNLAASSGMISGDETDDIHYLSQNHEIEEGDNVSHVSKYKTDGGAIAEGIQRGIIPEDKDCIIINADIFTNADISRTYNALKTLPDAGLVIPYYPVNAQRAKQFGLLGIEADDAGNLLIKDFVEKSPYTSEPPMPNDFVEPGEYDKAMSEYLRVQKAVDPNNEDAFLANPGFYYLSKEAAQVLEKQGIADSSKTGLGLNVMPKIVELANKGKFRDENGHKLKVYTVPLEAKGGKPAVWDDIGTAEAYLKLIKDVANEVQMHGTTTDNKYYGVPEFVLNDFAANTDLDTGIVYDSKEARAALDNFKDKYNVEDVRGNIFVAGK